MKERLLKYPAIYRHFKNKYYAVMGISFPLSKGTFLNVLKKNYEISLDSTIIKAQYTEIDSDNNKVLIIFDNKTQKWFHCKEAKKENNDIVLPKLVLYKSLYDDSGIYCRDFEMFLSEVDKEKYPQITQKYRFELIRY